MFLQVWLVAAESDEIVTSHEHRIRVKDLGAGRSIVDVVHAHQGVAQERREQPADLAQFLGVTGGLVDGGTEVHLPLGLDVPLGPIAEGERVLLHRGQLRPGELNLGDAGGQLATRALSSFSPLLTLSRLSERSNNV